MKIKITPGGMIPDDGSLHWYLHSIVGYKLTPKHCQEIERRAKVQQPETK